LVGTDSKQPSAIHGTDKAGSGQPPVSSDQLLEPDKTFTSSACTAGLVSPGASIWAGVVASGGDGIGLDSQIVEHIVGGRHIVSCALDIDIAAMFVAVNVVSYIHVSDSTNTSAS